VRISVVIDAKYAEEALKSVHQAFELDKPLEASHE